MKIDKIHIEKIRTHFAELQNKEDLAKLLSQANNYLYGKEYKPVQLKSVTYYANPGLCKKRYHTFTIKKKSGADRVINSPVNGLKSLLRSLNFVLQCIYEPHEAATGFVLEKSIVDNAKKHVNHNFVLNIDLKDFFHSFDLYQVKFALLRELWGIRNLKEYKIQNPEEFLVKDELAFIIANLCTHSMMIGESIKKILPQGSPTSPTLTNILCKRLDHRLKGLANRFGAKYSRYADDITFSSPHNIYKKEANNQLNKIGCYDNFLAELERIIHEEALSINSGKVRLQKFGYRQEVTGLIVNDKVNVRRKYVKQIRMWLYYWEKYGYEKAEQIFKRDYIADKGHVKNMNAHLVNVLDGKLEFLKMVKGVEDGTFKGLKERFDKLIALKETKDQSKIDLNSVLNTLVNQGLNKAMNLYSKFKNQ